MIIYKTTNLINGKIYIGQDRNNNPSYLGSGKSLIKAIKKYGKETFKKEILEECTDNNHLNEREVYWISFYNSRDRKVGYNISEGGKEGDRKIGHDIAKNGIYNYWIKKYGKEEADIRKKQQFDKLTKHIKENGTALTKKGRYTIWLEKYGKEEADRKHLEWRQKISDYQKIKMQNGWTHTEETKNKIKESSKGRKHSEETKNKMRKPKPEGFGKKKGRPVEQYDLFGNFIKCWESASEASIKLKICGINRVCQGKRKSAGNYKWKYKNKTNEK